ncbi:IS30 family transposase [Mycobacterium sp. SMC-18]|uniref:IS30 family transposase n=2 Tax=Mycobacteriaceae TaxID=1762 RepID=UPI00299EC6EA|nr:IS30 family transposase [Mycolicibacterium sp. 141076]MDX1881074.1 IS30 family transposase [Mycolicibacterium sp. 141076]
MRPGPLPSVVRLFWSHVSSELSIDAAAVAAGVSPGTGWQWFVNAGGVKPKIDSAPRKYTRLTFAEREQIGLAVAAQEPIRCIAKRLGRAPSTISREIKRNSSDGRNKYRPQFRFGAPWRGGPLRRPHYFPSAAQGRAQRKARRPHPRKLATSARLHTQVQTWLKDFLSPEQIARQLVVEFPDDLEMRVSHETIYQSIYVQGKGNLRRELHTCLRTGRALRHPRRRAGERRGRIPGIINISERPAEALDRAVAGHWEGDLILGSTESGSAIGTLVERSTRYAVLLHLPENHTAEAVQNAIVAKMPRLPAMLRQTLTWDQGKEMANHAQITEAIDLDIYFCDPHSPWQRGTNENTNGLLRQWFPKGSDLSIFPEDYLDHVAAKLNNRPRKPLDWKTPAQRLDELLSDPSDPPAVALGP